MTLILCPRKNASRGLKFKKNGCIPFALAAGTVNFLRLGSGSSCFVIPHHYTGVSLYVVRSCCCVFPDILTKNSRWRRVAIHGAEHPSTVEESAFARDAQDCIDRFARVTSLK